MLGNVFLAYFARFTEIISRRNPDVIFPVFARPYRPPKLEGYNLLSLWALSAFADFKFNLLVFFQATESVALNLGVVHEDILRAIFRSDEAETFFSVKPFNGSFCHVKTFSFGDGSAKCPRI